MVDANSVLVSYFGKMKKHLLLFALATSILCVQSACKSSAAQKSNADVAPTVVVENATENWVLVWAKDFDADSSNFPRGKPYLALYFGNGTVNGNTGCNQLHGKFTFAEEEHAISFKDLAATKMYCSGVKESEFLTLLRRATHYKKDDLTLTLLEDSTALLQFKKAD